MPGPRKEAWPAKLYFIVDFCSFLCNFSLVLCAELADESHILTFESVACMFFA